MGASFVDSSAVAKRYHIEPGTQEVTALLVEAKLLGRPVYISQLAVLEVQSVFAKKVRSGVITVDDSDVLRNRFLRDLREGPMQVIRMRTAHYEQAASLLQQYGRTLNLRTLDAIQLAVALDLLRRGFVDTFISSDRALCGVAQKTGFEVRNPEQP